MNTIYAHPNVKKKIKKRPLLKDMDAAKDLFNKRLSLYRAVADIEIKVSGRSIEDISHGICKKIAKN
jgi:shikimate kinase